MSSSKMVSQLYNDLNVTKKTLIKKQDANTNISSSNDVNTKLNNVIDSSNVSDNTAKYKNLLGQDRENWMTFQKNYLSTYHPFYSLYNQTPQNLQPNSKEFMEQAWDNYQYRYE